MHTQLVQTLPSVEDGILAKEVSRAQPISSPVPEHVVLLPQQQ